jgi:hypothetical protein
MYEKIKDKVTKDALMAADQLGAKIMQLFEDEDIQPHVGTLALTMAMEVTTRMSAYEQGRSLAEEHQITKDLIDAMLDESFGHHMDDAEVAAIIKSPTH